jgi:FixJ family two-component response regulator
MSETKPIVHVVDDDGSFRSAASRLLRAAGHVVECYASADEFLSRARPGAPGCVLADLQMPGKSGLELQRALASMPEPLPLVFLTAHGDIPTSVKALKGGAEDFLTKTAPREELLAAVTRAIERDAVERVGRARSREVASLLGKLTPRESEVLALVVRGKLNKEIAAELGIHERTVKLHRTAITTKLAVPSVAGLTRLAQEAGILP